MSGPVPTVLDRPKVHAEPRRVRLPYNFTPRSYQIPLFRWLDRGGKRASLEWHRKSGKDVACLNATILQAVDRPANYYHIYPEYAQGRKAMWDDIDPDTGVRYIDAFPPELVKSRNAQEMRIELVNGSIWQVTGSDTLMERGVGPNPAGIVWSEYSLTNPAAPMLYRPILLVNKGWEVYNFTPRGNNHATRQHDLAMGRPDEWYASTLTIDDTGLLARADVDSEIANGMDADLAMQEYYCSRTVAQAGAYYGKQMADLGSEGRITVVPHDPDYEVVTGWDIGVGDPTSIWFVQVSRAGQWRVIDHHTASGEPCAYYAEEIDKRRRKGWRFGAFYGPHDLRNRDKGNAEPLYEQYQKVGVKFTIVDQHDPLARIQKTRKVMPSMWFNELTCREGIESLKGYTKPWDKVRSQWGDGYVRNGCQHSADALGYLVMGYQAPVGKVDWAPGMDF